jgi:hypothetical protein
MGKRRKEIEVDIEELDPEDLARALGWMRIGFGVALFVAPHKMAKLWTGRSGEDVPTTLALRGMGARDIALGLGLALALERGAPVRGWLEGGALSDAADAVGTLSVWRDLPTWKAALLFASEVGAAYLGSQLAQSMD